MNEGPSYAIIEALIVIIGILAVAYVIAVHA